MIEYIRISTDMSKRTNEGELNDSKKMAIDLVPNDLLSWVGTSCSSVKILPYLNRQETGVMRWYWDEDHDEFVYLDSNIVNDQSQHYESCSSIDGTFMIVHEGLQKTLYYKS